MRVLRIFTLLGLMLSLTAGVVYAQPGKSGDRWLAKKAAAKADRQAREQADVPDDGSRQLDKELRRRSNRQINGVSRVIIELKPGYEASSNDIKSLGGKMGRRLKTFNGQVVELSNAQLKRLAKHPAVARIVHDRSTHSDLNRTAWAAGARAVQQQYGYTGAGIGVAVIDSGITPWHDDLSGGGPGNQRVVKFVDFINGQTTPYDDYGHGTHIAGIIEGNGYDSNGSRMGIAPGVNLVVLKALDGNGSGTISSIIAAIDYAVANKNTYNIRVLNLSIGAGIYESYETDPLTLAAKRAVDAGIVVVASAGNMGQRSGREVQYGGITSPGNAPWVLTVGASSSMGTVTRGDDTIGLYSSRGPSAVDYLAKPDLVAHGSGIVSLSASSSRFYQTKSSALVAGTVATASMPYIALTGTSMAAPVVAGTVALMLEANPNLTPNLVKAILEYTSQEYDGYDALTQGAGFLNVKGATRLAKFFLTAQPGDPYPATAVWSRQILWGNYRLQGGLIDPAANAWRATTVWGSAFSSDGGSVVLGSECPALNCDSAVWGSSFDGDNIVWGSHLDGDNIVWGSHLDGDNIVWGSSILDNIVWGSNCGGLDCDNIVWGSNSFDFDNIVWGSSLDFDNIVWGSSGLDMDNVVWGSSLDLDNIIWGSSLDLDNIVWGSSLAQQLIHVSGDPTLAEMAEALAFDEPMPEPAPVPAPVVTPIPIPVATPAPAVVPPATALTTPVRGRRTRVSERVSERDSKRDSKRNSERGGRR